MSSYDLWTAAKPQAGFNAFTHHAVGADPYLSTNTYGGESVPGIHIPIDSNIVRNRRSTTDSLYPLQCYSQPLNNYQRLKLNRGALKRRRFQSEAYSKYRTGHANKKGMSSDQVWPDEWEEIFWDALLEHPPRGRTKESKLQGSKLTGRNEDIAEYMRKYLSDAWDKEMERKRNAKLQDGKPEDAAHVPRKFISSHIQVLKIKFQDDPYILDLLSEDKQKYRRNTKKGTRRQTRAGLDANWPHEMEESTSFPMLYPSYFTMQIEREGEVIDTCCDSRRSQIIQGPDVNIEKVPEILKKFLMSTKYQSCFYPGGVNTLWADVTLDKLAMSSFKQAALTVDCKLATNLPAATTNSWYSKMSYFSASSGNLRCAVDGKDAVYGPIAIGPMTNSGLSAAASSFSCIFGSSFWARELARIRETVAFGMNSGPSISYDEVSQPGNQANNNLSVTACSISTRLANVIGVQQIWGHAPLTAHDRPLWILVWSFSTPRVGIDLDEPATAITWRKVDFDLSRNFSHQETQSETINEVSPASTDLGLSIITQARPTPSVAMQAKANSQSCPSEAVSLPPTTYVISGNNAVIPDFSDIGSFTPSHSHSREIISHAGSAESSLKLSSIDHHINAWLERETAERTNVDASIDINQDLATNNLSLNGIGATCGYDYSNMHLTQPELFLDLEPSANRANYADCYADGGCEWAPSLAYSDRWTSREIPIESSFYGSELGIGITRFSNQQIQEQAN